MYVLHTFLDSDPSSKQFSFFPANITRCLVCCCALVSAMSRSLYSLPVIYDVIIESPPRLVVQMRWIGQPAPPEVQVGSARG